MTRVNCLLRTEPLFTISNECDSPNWDGNDDENSEQ